MRTLAFGTALSGVLWGAIAWCGLALQVATGHNRFGLSAHDLGAALLVLDLSFLTVFVWIVHQADHLWSWSGANARR